jgi:hypothetical protein
MTEGSTQDSESGDFFPDPLTLNYHAFTMSDAPTAVELTDTQIERFWHTTYEQLGGAYYDDIVLMLNNVGHKNFLSEGDVVLFPSLSDITSSFAL